jgi:hypothetical protein
MHAEMTRRDAATIGGAAMVGILGTVTGIGEVCVQSSVIAHAGARAVADNNALLAERLAQLLDRDVRLRLQDREDRVFVTLNPLGPVVSAHRSRPRLARSRSSARHRLTLAALTPNRSPT